MKNRLDAMSDLGIPTEFHACDGLGHGFGLGTGTIAEGWIDDAIAFWAGSNRFSIIGFPESLPSV